MADDFFELTGIQDEIKRLMRDLERMNNTVAAAAQGEALDKACDIMLAEERRILQAHPTYSTLAPLLKRGIRRKYSRAYGWCGYDTETIEAHPEALVIEFGRPGKRGRAKGKDSMNRKIGVIQPYSHIRAAILNKKSEVYKAIGDVLNQKVNEVWNERK